ncbi:SDR family NAD(P)-dependent oxidoreductase [Parafrankia discariae]|uniref:SDR family NAD(P)-dependent oxidoreductase n=1 Tax=Parafrankia discariae TaxID=365528 RepID=UPI000378D855|nr:SDR family NAD(P)-dependent oxidoreductase [Parafrankia discariae]
MITGASEGTGQAFARRIAAEGLPSVLLARRLGPLTDLADSIRAETGVECVSASVDLASDDGAQQVIEAVGDREIGLYIANAGADPNGAHFLDVDVEPWLKLMRLNVLTMMQLCHHFGGAMRARRRGGLLLVNSGAAYGGSSFMAAYTGSKAFELCFGESLWAELRPYNVDVLNLVLGKTDTPAFRALLAKNGLPEPTDWATPQDVAEAGVTRLPHGPIHNQGQAADTVGDERRSRVLMIEEMSKSVFGEKAPD